MIGLYPLDVTFPLYITHNKIILRSNMYLEMLLTKSFAPLYYLIDKRNWKEQIFLLKSPDGPLIIFLYFYMRFFLWQDEEHI